MLEFECYNDNITHNKNIKIAYTKVVVKKMITSDALFFRFQVQIKVEIR